MDADVRADSDTDLSTPKVTGTISLYEGLFQLASVGEEFRDAKAKVILSADGSVAIKDAEANGLTGKVTLQASAHLDALRVRDASAKIEIPDGHALPILSGGTQVAQLTGKIGLKLRWAPGSDVIVSKVEISPLLSNLPLTSAHDVQALEVAANTHVGVYHARKDFRAIHLTAQSGNAGAAPATAPANPITLRVPIHLGDNVIVKRGTDLQVQLETCPFPKDENAPFPACTLMVTVTDKVQVRGQITLRSGGFLEVQGKRFEIEKGIVSFVGDDPTNPEISVTARWPAPDGTIVYADFIGLSRPARSPCARNRRGRKTRSSPSSSSARPRVRRRRPTPHPRPTRPPRRGRRPGASLRRASRRGSTS